MGNDSQEAHRGEVSDRLAIVDLAVSYANAVDSRDWNKLRDVFTADAEWNAVGFGEPAKGIDAIVARLRSTLEHLDLTQHIVSNHAVRFHDAGADHSCYVLGQHIKRGLQEGDQFMGAGRYDDQVRLLPDGWRISRRVLTALWTMGNPSILAP